MKENIWTVIMNLNKENYQRYVFQPTNRLKFCAVIKLQTQKNICASELAEKLYVLVNRDY